MQAAEHGSSNRPLPQPIACPRLGPMKPTSRFRGSRLNLLPGQSRLSPSTRATAEHTITFTTLEASTYPTLISRMSMEILRDTPSKPDYSKRVGLDIRPRWALQAAEARRGLGPAGLWFCWELASQWDALPLCPQAEQRVPIEEPKVHAYPRRVIYSPLGG